MVRRRFSSLTHPRQDFLSFLSDDTILPKEKFRRKRISFCLTARSFHGFYKNTVALHKHQHQIIITMVPSPPTKSSPCGIFSDAVCLPTGNGAVPAVRTGQWSSGSSVSVNLPAPKRKEIQDALEFAMKSRALGPNDKFSVNAKGIKKMPRLYFGLAHDSEIEHIKYLKRRFGKDFIVHYLTADIPTGMGHECESALTGAAQRPVYDDFVMSVQNILLRDGSRFCSVEINTL